ncbi:MAG: VTC domain-containing protein, partial [Acidimicrobiia bacterium]|nr:VTC domain-containing protein [Acidimicrobiia bacterium]
MMVGMFEQSTGRLSSVSLEEISGEASLMRRYDHKYVTMDVRADDFIATLNDDWLVLRIGREPSHLYRTTYFDDIRCRTYRDHVQGRRPRFKIRSRTYQNGASFLEVKMKTGRGQTDKRRI